MKAVFKVFFVAAFIIIAGFSIIDKIVSAQDNKAVFNGLNTYSWSSNIPSISGLTRGDDINADSRIKKIAEEELAKKGYILKDNNPDFLIDYNLNLKDNTKVVNITADDRYGDRDSVQEFDKGKIVLEFINPRTRKVLWSGNTKADAYRYAIIERKLTVIDKAIRKILSEVPSKG